MRKSTVAQSLRFTGVMISVLIGTVLAEMLAGGTAGAGNGVALAVVAHSNIKRIEIQSRSLMFAQKRKLRNERINQCSSRLGSDLL